MSKLPRTIWLLIGFIMIVGTGCQASAPTTSSVSSDAAITAIPTVTTPADDTPFPAASAVPTPSVTYPSLPAQKISAPLRVGESAANFKLTPDGRTAVYVADMGDYERTPRFYSASLDGGPTIDLTRTFTTTGFFHRFEVSPDSRMLVWNQSPSGNVFAVPISGGDVVKLNASVHHPYQGTDASYFFITPDSRMVLFLATERDGTSTDGLYRVPIKGGEATRISTARLDPSLVAISPDSSTVVYAQRTDEQTFDLYAAPLQGGEPIVLQAGIVLPMTAFGVDYTMPLPFEITPDGTSVVYAHRQLTDPFFALYRVPIRGGDVRQLNDPQTVDESLYDFTISPDSKTVVYRTGAEPSMRNDVPQHAARVSIRSVPLDGGPLITLSPPLIAGGEIYDTAISADSRYVVYTAEQDTDEVVEMYRVPIAGGEVYRLSGERRVPSKTLLFSISPRNDYVVYSADMERVDKVEVLCVPLDGGATIELTEDVPDRNRAYGRFSPDGRYVLFNADITFPTQPALYLWSSRTQQTWRVGEGYPSNVEMSADGRLVVYSANGERPNSTDLYRAVAP